MSTIEALPNEIIANILSSLPTLALQQTILTSHRLRVLSELVLYSAVIIQEGVVLSGSQDGGPYKTWRWCRTILERPHLVDFVKSLTIRWFTDHHRFHLNLSLNNHPHYPGGMGTVAMVDEIDLEPVFIELATILPSLVLLQSLELHLTPVRTSPTGLDPRLILGSRLLSSLTFPNLSQLTLTGLIPPPDFLSSSVPNLSILRLTDVHDLPYQFPGSAIPHLSTFKGSPAAAAAILPNRPVKTLSLVGCEYLKIPEWQAINRVHPAPSVDGQEGIETLDLSGMSVTPNLLRDVAKWVPTVRVLKVRLALRHTLHYAFGGISLLTALSPVLLSLTRLRSLDFSPTVGIGTARVEEELALCKEWSQVCGLTKVVFPSGDIWVLTSLAKRADDLQDGMHDRWILAGGTRVDISTGKVTKHWWRDVPSIV